MNNTTLTSFLQTENILELNKISNTLNIEINSEQNISNDDTNEISLKYLDLKKKINLLLNKLN